MTSDADLDETAIIARDLIRFDTSNFGEGRSNGEADAAEYVAQKLVALGLEPQMFESAPGRVSVVAHVKGREVSTGSTGEAKGKLVVHGHLDVVPAIAENWSVDPFEGVIKDGMLWGRGAVDMKNMDAMILTALGDILGAGERPARDLVIAFFADEEAGGVHGSGYLVREHPELFDGATAAISEVGGYSIMVGDQRAYLLQTGEKALIWAKLVARGTAGHGSRIHPDNAITRLAEAVAKVGRLEWPVRLTDTTEQLLGEIAASSASTRSRSAQTSSPSPPERLELHPGVPAQHHQPHAALPPATSTTSSPTRRRRSSTSAPSRAKKTPCIAAIAGTVGPDIEIVTCTATSAPRPRSTAPRRARSRRP
jgi:acetylornithine deacetylase/succinyl-diaminopimelate desuccinylase-like protein